MGAGIIDHNRHQVPRIHHTDAVVSIQGGELLAGHSFIQSFRHKPATFSFFVANEMTDRYIHFYAHERIRRKTGVAPLTLRHSC